MKSYPGAAVLPVALGGHLVDVPYLPIHDERMVGREHRAVISHHGALMEHRFIIDHIEDRKLAESRH